MKKLVVALPLVLLVAVCGLLTEGPERESVPAGVADLEIGRPVTSGNLTIFPILSRTPRTTDRFITLDEGLANGTVEVVEVGADGEAVEPANGGSDEADPNAAPHPHVDPVDLANPEEVLGRLPPVPVDERPDGRDPTVTIEPVDVDVAAVVDPAAEDPEEVAEQAVDLRSGSPSAPAVFTEAAAAQVNRVLRERAEREPGSLATNDEDPWSSREDESGLSPEVIAVAEETLESDPFGGLGGGEAQNGFGWGGSIAAGPEVNRLLVKNTSGKPLYLMPGEVVIGGQQDRTIAEPTVLASSEEWQSIDAFCVESGRWEDRDGAATVSLLAAVHDGDLDDIDADKLVAEANAGKFVASNIALNPLVRKVVLTGDGQDEVWNKVAEQNDLAGVADATKTSAFTANYGSEEVAAELHDYEGDLLDAIRSHPRVVGVVVAVNGEVRGSDVFESTPLFRKLWPKLLKSYALDAYGQAASEGDAAAFGPVDGRAAKAFLVKAFRDTGRATGRGNGIELHEKSSDGIVSYENVYESEFAEPAGGLGGGMGGYGGAVQQSAFH